MAAFLVIHGRNKGEWYTVGERPLVLGRDDTLLAEILDPCVSRRHLEVRYEAPEAAHYAVDLGSRNGVVLNGQRIKGFKALGDFDLVQIGHTLMVYTAGELGGGRDVEVLLESSVKKHHAVIDEINELENKRLQRVLDGQ